VDNPFNPSGNYSALRAQATTKADVGLGSADNTSDMAKPVSTAVQGALNEKADTSGTYAIRATGTTKEDVGLSHVSNVESYSKTEADLKYLGKTAKATDSDKLGGLDSSQFLNADSLEAAISQAPALVDGLRRSVEAASGGNMTVFYTANGLPSYFTRIPKFLCEDVVSGGQIGAGTHEAFIFDGVEDSEIWVGTYQSSIINGEAVSQPGVAPAHSLIYDEARTACQNAGTGFDLQTNWDWAAIVFWSLANGFQSRGNTDQGRNLENRWEVGTRQDGGAVGSPLGNGSTLTGSGPAYWRHDGTYSGISDMVGNVWEWCSGLKVVGGRVFLSADNYIPIESLYVDSGFDLEYESLIWSELDATGASEILRRALVVPKGVNDALGRISTNTFGDRPAMRGGSRFGNSGGLGSLNLSSKGTVISNNFGFRLRYRQP